MTVMSTGNRPEVMSGPEAAARAGITYRQLDYWTRTGAITPSIQAHGSGSRRAWTTQEVDRLLIVARLHGLLGTATVAQIGALWRWLSKRDRWPDLVSLGRVGDQWVVYPGIIYGTSITVSTVGSRTRAETELLEEGVQQRMILDTAPL